MLEFLLVKYLHFVGIFFVVGTLSTEVVLMKKQLKRKEIQLLSRVDMVYGLSTVIVLTAGFILWFYVGKPSDFYTNNWIFILKLIVFGCVGALSIYPTVFFIKNRKGADEELVTVPVLVQRMIYFEVGLLLLIPLCAVLMANGVGSF